MSFRLGLIINPYAGIGGALALKGSDGVDIREKALAMGAQKRANERTAKALELLLPYQGQLTILTAGGEMGEDLARSLGFAVEVIYQPPVQTEAVDTENTARLMLDKGIDLLLFAGGDGTARNICSIVEERVPVLGIPAGCKIHSGVYCVTPQAAGRVVEMMLKGELVSLQDADVMDIDEQGLREGKVRTRRFGEMLVPSELRYVQATKVAGRESDELVLADIAAHVIELMDDEYFVMGSGSTVAAIMEELGLDNTLLGVDLVKDRELVGWDLTAQELLASLEGQPAKLVITLIGGQGHIFGRGNQQLSPALIRAIGRDNILVVATKKKLQSLAGRPLIADTGDAELDKSLSGFIPVITGYHDQVLYPVSSPGNQE
ncbi:ATP-NAD kinase family protein [Aliiglaciecola sp. CAU 1673]|uniref:ATP-NAD kinase family protein n=1 Tax=Aliiglaciecola sp. CAU 1673 TaxID=3032595 RepID=UPI0023DB7902|nr:ATP-NAD kinase family protein [Aliiglaciecola sp. CAU 1673]MDF2178042.1 ATP-NAD kinase family protein [Aliiglaciecola sp. CAU 1673]